MTDNGRQKGRTSNTKSSSYDTNSASKRPLIHFLRVAEFNNLIALSDAQYVAPRVQLDRGAAKVQLTATMPRTPELYG
ncbi:Uncharacterised protein [Amycolatopsis camponoti]|uniref:Uncharacterized protein n=1 Tax=Amycolatopsis camponoti TaxID=2606593 RepID=A0A6I8LIJ0_9PSEU|nr:Uncharacterised protein [Amycolatopsis camponoti]